MAAAAGHGGHHHDLPSSPNPGSNFQDLSCARFQERLPRFSPTEGFPLVKPPEPVAAPAPAKQSKSERLKNRRARSARFKTQPITFDEIKETEDEGPEAKEEEERARRVLQQSVQNLRESAKKLDRNMKKRHLKKREERAKTEVIVCPRELLDSPRNGLTLV
ncbi:PREDICTED: uncharacterized protein C11orf96 homolog [Branchiostoma belcheri]|uniref:Uncharacterized protein C11orf96 homolog n=1 Tax=Branchiostoma belcheri TaxID=7741 RepID=A0A6P4ZKH9_BRABE|nr:PREDICTED: uncharacterized protein C11orf96 homolog [Branchiostoma belcheri]